MCDADVHRHSDSDCGVTALLPTRAACHGGLSQTALLKLGNKSNSGKISDFMERWAPFSFLSLMTLCEAITTTQINAQLTKLLI